MTASSFNSSFNSFFGQLTELCAHMLWPVSCPVCGTVGRLLCEPCLRSLLKPQPPRCLWCGEDSPCKIHRENPAKIRAGALYGGHVKELILALKYGRYEVLGFRLGKALAEIFPRPEMDALVPVPLHLKSRRRYNQAGAIARGMGGVWGIEVSEAARWTIDTASHAGMNAAGRMSLRSDAFEFGGDVAGLRIGLVDDVATTGATLSRLAAAARSSGAEPAAAYVVAASPR